MVEATRSSDNQVQLFNIRAKPRTAVSFEQTFRNLDNALRKEAGCTTELDYTEQTSWLLCLRYLDSLEDQRELEAKLAGKPFMPILDQAHRWDVWTAPGRSRRQFRP